ncbi:MAG: hypothetical protein AABP62_14820, partial [Planctomycetota bacterium]
MNSLLQLRQGALLRRALRREAEVDLPGPRDLGREGDEIGIQGRVEHDGQLEFRTAFLERADAQDPLRRLNRHARCGPREQFDSDPGALQGERLRLVRNVEL